MPELNPIAYKDFIKKLRKFGFIGPFEGGKHLYLLKENVRLTIPNPHKKSVIGVDLLSRLLKQANITKKQWFLDE